MASDITLDELMAALKDAGFTGDESETVEGLTSKEWMERWNCSAAAFREKADAAQKLGILKVNKRSIARIDGGRIRVPVYAFEVPTKRRKRKAT